jgi:hypothetical protein
MMGLSGLSGWQVYQVTGWQVRLLLRNLQPEAEPSEATC